MGLEEILIIEQSGKLSGEVTISGAKNAAVGIIPAAILTDEKCLIKNLPSIRDVVHLRDMMIQLGAKVKLENQGEMLIDSSSIKDYKIDFELAKEMRASYYFLGALLGKYKKAVVPFPGGDDIGVRPIDLHIKGFEALGAKIKIAHGTIRAEADELIGASIYMDVVSVGATINIMLAACRAKGLTIIENAAKEPHVVDIANFLNAMGANIRGAGTDVIKIKGVDYLGSCEHAIIPDMLEAGTYMIAAAASKGNVLIQNVIPTHLEAISAKLREMGVEITEYEEAIRVNVNSKLKAINIKTMPYPGFPTDLQQPMTALLSVSDGTSIITEGIWDGRFRHVEELKKMGANIRVEGRVAIIEGVNRLSGSMVHSWDIRAGAAMVVAGLIAEGETHVSNIKHIDRGYEDLEKKLINLGARIRRVER